MRGLRVNRIIPTVWRFQDTLTLFLLSMHTSILSATLEWRKSTPMPEPRSGYAAGVLDGKLVIAGGTYWEGSPGNWKTKIFTAIVHTFDPATEQWEKIPELPVALGYAASATVRNKLYVLGGYTGQYANRKIYTLEKGSRGYVWKVFGDLPDGRLFARAEVVASSIYLLGGSSQFEPLDAAGTCCTSSTATQTFFKLDTTPASLDWRSLAPFPGPRRWLFSTTTDGHYIWMFGGADQEKAKDPVKRFREVFRYRIREGKWEPMPLLPEGAVEAAPLTPVNAGGRILLVSYAKKVWELNPANGQFELITPLPEEAFVDVFVWLNNRIVGAGGENRLNGPRRRSEWTFVGRFVEH